MTAIACALIPGILVHTNQHLLFQDSADEVDDGVDMFPRRQKEEEDVKTKEDKQKNIMDFVDLFLMDDHAKDAEPTEVTRISLYF